MRFKAVAATTVIIMKLAPHTVFLDRYRKFRAAYGFDRKEMPVPKTVGQRFQDVMDDLKIPLCIRHRIKLFTVYDIQMFQAGTTVSSYGAVIGIPQTYGYEAPEYLSINEIEIEATPWTQEAVEKFHDSLILSENAQKFAIAREVLKVQRPDIWLKMFNTLIDVLLMLTLHDMLYTILQLAKKSLFSRYMLKFSCGLFGLVLWIGSENVLNTAIDQEITDELVKLGPKYIEGGKEYYEKLCTLESIMNGVVHNKLLKLSKWIKKYGLPASEQKDFFTLKLQELEGSVI